MKLELLHHPAKNGADRAPLLFVHGSFCGAWVWNEYFLPFFAENGYDAYALSLRGHGRSEGQDRLRAHGLADYVDDVIHTLDHIGRPAVLLGHSMGGLIVQKVIERRAAAGMVLVNSVPPEGLAATAVHMAVVAPDLLWNINVMQIFGQKLVPPEAMHRAFFSSRTRPSEVTHFMAMMQEESQQVMFDLMRPDLLPRPGRLPDGVKALPPALVLGADCDVMIPTLALHQTARAYGADLDIMTGAPHGVMLDNCWPEAAQRILNWLEKKAL